MGVGHHSLEDREYLRTLTTPHLRKVLRNTRRSRTELTEYINAISIVLDEREKADAQEG
jgi:hypothetical protein